MDTPSSSAPEAERGYINDKARYADAIPLALLKREQDRILGELDDVNRRLCNQAFFTKIYVEHQRPYEMLTDPEVDANALT